MNKPLDDELLSAYLDGELVAPERAGVETWLTSDPAARRTLAELRAVREAVSALPHEQLGEDLTAKVLQLAEHRMLSETPDTEDPPAASPLSPRRFLGRRAVVWAGLAVAAALLIALSDRERRAPQPAPQGPAPLVTQREPAPATQAPREPPVLRPMPGENKDGIYAAKPQAAGSAKQQAILLIKCFIRAEAPRNVLDTLLARQRIVRDESDRLINNAVDRLGLRAKQTPPQGLVAVGDPSYIYAEATARQIEGVLEAIAARARDFPALVVEPGQKGQEAWRAYSRGAESSGKSAAAAPPAADDQQQQPLLLVVQPVKPAAPKK